MNVNSNAGCLIFSLQSHMTARHLYSSISNVSNVISKDFYAYMKCSDCVFLFISVPGKRISSSLFPQSFAADPGSLSAQQLLKWGEGTSPWQPGMIRIHFIYLFSCPSISVCISLAFSNLPKHLCMSSWERNLLLSRVSRHILFLFIWMHVICCHSNHSLFSLEYTQKSHICCHKK